MSVFQIISRKDIIKRSLIVALVVGTILNIINQGDAIMMTGSINMLKCVLTYMVPYCVATYGAVSALKMNIPTQN